MNYLISFAGTSLPAGTTKVNFDTGKLTDSAGNEYNLSGASPSIESINIMTSVSTTLHTEGDTSNIIVLPTNRYVRFRANIETMKIVSTAAFNLVVIASIEPTGAPEIT